jgi:hypothetical protein
MLDPYERDCSDHRKHRVSHSFSLIDPAYRTMRYVRADLHEKARKDFPHSPAGKACSKTVVFSGSGDAKTVKNQ